MDVCAATTIAVPTMPTMASDARLEADKKQELVAQITALPDNQAILEALRRVPELVEEESSPMKFLQFDNGCIEAAAQRLVNNWKERVLWFGDRAFLPLLDLSGNGALAAAQVEEMQSGIVVQLPNDKAGRPVVLVDPERIDMDESKVQYVLFRLRMYILCKLVHEQEGSKPFELVVIRVMATAEKDMHLIKTARKGFVEVLQAFPVALGAYHFCSVTAADPSKHYSNMVLPALLQSMGRKWLDSVQVHVAKDSDAMGQKLSEFGLERQSLPLTLGGKWSYTAFEAWLTQNSRVLKATPESATPLVEEDRDVAKRPASSAEEASEQACTKRLKETSTNNMQVSPMRAMSVWMAALRGIRNDRQCSVRELLRRPGVRLHGLSVVSKDNTSLSVARCKEQLESVLSHNQVAPSIPSKDQGVPPVKEDIKDRLTKAHIRGRLLKKLQALANERQKENILVPQRDVTLLGTTRRKLPAQTVALRTALVSKVLQKLKRSS